MRKTTRLFGVVMAIMLCVAMVTPVAHAEAAFPDVTADNPYAEAIALLKQLTIVGGDDKGNFNPTNTITRAEFAKIVYVLYNGTPNAPKTASKFPDVAANAWFNGYVNWAADKGIVGGRDTGMFDPNAPVTVAEASKMFVVAITGDNTLAWPTGFETKANELGLYAGATYDGVNSPAARQLIAQFAKNAIGAASVLLNASTPAAVYFDAVLNAAKVEQKMLVSTWKNNIGINAKDQGFNGMYSAEEGMIAVADFGLPTYTDTLKSSVNVKYVGLENIDGLRGLPVTVYYNAAGEATRVALLGTKADYKAGDLTSADGKYFAKGVEIQVDWAMLAFDDSNNSARAYTTHSNMTYLSNPWSGAKRFFDCLCDEDVTLVDTNGDGAYDWIFSEYVFNGMEVALVMDNEILMANNTRGSITWTGWVTTGAKFITEDTIKEGDFVNVKVHVTDPDSGVYKVNRNGAPLNALFIVSKAETVTGKLEAVTRTTANDISFKLGGVEYKFSEYFSSHADADGTDGASSGRDLIAEANIGKDFMIVLDSAGFAVLARQK